jgi:holo-[acyl-carrier protein] synthase
MSVISHGVDIVECSRIAELLERHPDRFLERILTAKERDHAQSIREPVPHIAGRFAAKEAILKVLGTGWRGQIAWTDIEILNNRLGQPHVTLGGECGRVAKGLGIGRILLSISHTSGHAVASAIGVA